MAKLAQNFDFWKGDYKRLRFQVEDTGSLDDCKAWWAMASTQDPVSPDLSKSTETDPAKITFEGVYAIVEIDETDTDENSLIDAGEYFHELRIEDSYGKLVTAAVGVITVKSVIIKTTT